MGKVAYTIAEAARAASCTEGHVAEAIKAGDLKARRVGRRTVIVAKRDLVKWLTRLPTTAS